MAVIEDNTAGVTKAEVIGAGVIGGLTGSQMMGMIEVVELSETRRSTR